MNRRLPAYVPVVFANLVPIYGAVTGRLVFFQVLYLFWLEGFIITFFNLLRVATAQGRDREADVLALVSGRPPEPHYGFFYRAGLILRCLVGRCLIMGFYLIFIILFVLLQVSDTHNHRIFESLLFRDAYFNLSLLAYFIAGLTHYIRDFLISGTYRWEKPATYAYFLDGRIIVMHVSLVGIVILHQWMFAGKTYEAKGEILYVAIFMLLKTMLDLFLYDRKKDPETSGIF